MLIGPWVLHDCGKVKEGLDIYYDPGKKVWTAEDDAHCFLPNLKYCPYCGEKLDARSNGMRKGGKEK